jgi:hypothetical protein
MAGLMIASAAMTRGAGEPSAAQLLMLFHCY